MSIRCRFAPSPTGFLHVGSARCALFNWLFARANEGTFVLRIEDTDTERNRPELIDVIFNELKWLGIDWDEGPYFQSQRLERHQEIAQDLLNRGRAYVVDAQNERIDTTEILPDHAVRYSVPKGQRVAFTDTVRGEVSFNTDDLEDFVIWRSNGTPTFLLANAADDADMGITHAIRGEDLLSSTPKVQLLLAEMQATPPTYAHLPLLVNQQRKKLSKRRDDVSISDYRLRGYRADAMVNYLALLGWGPDDDIEIRPIQEIVQQFSLERVSKASAFFDVAKLDHFNATYIQQMSPQDFAEAVLPYLKDSDALADQDIDVETVEKFASEVQKRVSKYQDADQWYDWLFCDEVTFDEKSFKKGLLKAKKADEVLEGVLQRFKTCEWQSDILAKAVREVGDELEVRSQVPVRVAVTGRAGGIPLFEPLEILGREKSVARIEKALTELRSRQ